MMAFFFDDADQKHNANDGNNIEIALKKSQCQHRPHTGRWKRGDDRQGMDQALIKNSQNYIDGQQCEAIKIGSLLSEAW